MGDDIQAIAATGIAFCFSLKERVLSASPEGAKIIGRHGAAAQVFLSGYAKKLGDGI